MANFIKRILIDGVDLNSIVHVVEVNKPLTASKENRQKEINALDGISLTGSKLSSFSMTVSIALIGTEEQIVQQKRELTKLLMKDELLRIELDTEPDCYYEGSLDGEIKEDDAYYDQHKLASFSLLIPRPYAFDKVESVAIFNNGEVNGVLNTAIGTEPIIEMTMTKALPSISIVGDDEIFTLGTPYDVATETPVNASPYILKDEMSSTSPWSTYTNDTEWTVRGTPYTNGWSFTQSRNEETQKPDYGTASNWHGFAVSRSLTEQLQDFEATMRIEFNNKVAKGVGKIELLGLDVNGVQIFKIALSDSSATAVKTNFEARTTNASGGGSTLYYGPGASANVWADFNGIIRMTREGLKYTAYIENQTGGKAHSRLTKTKTHTVMAQHGRKLARVVIRLGAYGTYTTPSVLAIHDLTIKKLGKVEVNQVDTVLQIGDNVTINSETGQVFKNGSLWMTDIYELSKFIKLKPGPNIIQIVPSDAATAALRFRRRFV